MNRPVAPLLDRVFMMGSLPCGFQKGEPGGNQEYLCRVRARSGLSPFTGKEPNCDRAARDDDSLRFRVLVAAGSALNGQ